MDFLKVCQTAEDPLDLVKHVLRVWLVVDVCILDFEDCFSKRWDHEKLLHDAVHVANTANVFESNESSNTSFVLCQSGDVPIGLSVGAPE